VNNAQLINQDSGDYEYYSPIEIVDAAREVMGGIDLDPASSKIANKTVGATRIYTLEAQIEQVGVWELPALIAMEGGLDYAWYGDVWMNHPFGRSETACKEGCVKEICRKRGYHTLIKIPRNKEWIQHAVNEHKEKRSRQLTCITYASTSEDWFFPLTEYPQCFLRPRTNYYRPDGTKKKGVSKGSVVTYMGNNKDLFRKTFEGFGWFR